MLGQNKVKNEQTEYGIKRLRTLKKASSEIGTSISFLKQLLREGRLSKYKIHSATFVSLAEFENLAQKRKFKSRMTDLNFMNESENSVECQLKLPINFTLTNCNYPRPARLIAYYEEFKAMAVQSKCGFIPKLLVDRNSTYRKWMNLLVDQKLAFKVSDGFRIRRRQFLWNWLGIERVFDKKIGRERYKYLKVSILLSLKRKDYINELIEYFERYSIQRKLNQCYFRQKKSNQGCVNGGRKRFKKQNLKAPLGMILISGKRFSKLTGHSSESTGLRKRKRYCVFIQKPKLLGNQFVPYKYSCAGVDVNLKKAIV